VKKLSGRQLGAAGIVALGFCLVATMYAVGLTDQNAASRDFIGYWAAGQQLVHHANPYDADATLRLEESVGLGDQEIKITPSPPAGLSLVLPLGLLRAKTGLVFWLMLQIACLAASIAVLWIIEGRPATRLHLFGFLFAPVVACMMAGQLGIFCLFGIVLFFWLYETQPFIAGVALLPCSLKPHLFLAIALVLVLWTIDRRSPRVIGGFVAALAASYAAVLTFDPHAWTQYMTMMQTAGMQDRWAPTFAAYLRMDVPPHALWMQYVPLGATCIWAAWFYWSRRDRWNWLEHGSLILLLSLLTTPYAWITDESILLPAVLFATYRAAEAKRSLLPIALFAGAALAELFANIRVTSWYFMWTVPAWLGWYLYATRGRRYLAGGAGKSIA
jgi:hypothetical protein